MRTDVTFVSKGLTPTGHLHTPESRAGHPLPAIAVIHPWGGVKEQAAGPYARRPTEAGFAALASDAAHQGACEGERRFLEHPVQRAEDIKSAVIRLGALGISASGHAVCAALSDLRSRTVGTVSAACLGSLLRVRLGGGQDPVVFRDPFARTGPLRVVEALGEHDFLEHIAPEEVGETTPDHLRQGNECYRTAHGARLRCENAWVLRRFDQIAQSDSFAGIEFLAPRPLLMIVGSEASTAHGQPNGRRTRRVPAELFWIDGTSRFGLHGEDEEDEYASPPSPSSSRSSASTRPATRFRTERPESPRTHARSTTSCPNGRSSRRRRSRSSPPSSRR
ncbi:alpha/beta hydrolase [Streptomyces sp. NPDC050538]|uniref:alpha/beta hydrolase n=1 Tax=Streptomyces sp. NPDC050538 TaxID=3365627 RepID=UPI0037938E93